MSASSLLCAAFAVSKTGIQADRNHGSLPNLAAALHTFLFAQRSLEVAGHTVIALRSPLLRLPSIGAAAAAAVAAGTGKNEGEMHPVGSSKYESSVSFDTSIYTAWAQNLPRILNSVRSAAVMIEVYPPILHRYWY